MAKGNMLLGQARGKVGDIVFSRANGQQITRARSAQVKNPQTQAQMVQRIMMNTVIQAYSAMSPITDHSFEGIKEGQDSMSFFMSKNIKLLRSLATEFGTDAESPRVVNLGESAIASNPWIIAKGTLPEIQFLADSDYSAIAGGSGNTYEALINYHGLQRGDQITFIVVDGLNASSPQFHYRRVILDPRNADGSEAPLTSAFITDGEINLPSPRNENYGVSLALSGSNISVGAADLGRIVFGRAVIVSRQNTDGSWLRSNAQMTVSADGAVGVSIDEAYGNFLASGLDFESNLYLNNAKRMAKTVTSSGGTGNNGGGSDGSGEEEPPALGG